MFKNIFHTIEKQRVIENSSINLLNSHTFHRLPKFSSLTNIFCTLSLIPEIRGKICVPGTRWSSLEIYLPSSTLFWNALYQVETSNIRSKFVQIVICVKPCSTNPKMRIVYKAVATLANYWLQLQIENK